jgi:hypothetical protein
MDLKSLAYELMRESQQQLQQDGHLTPTAVVITPHENLILDLEYESDEEREEIYSELVDVALEKNALAIVTVNDVYLESGGSIAALEGPGWGKLSESAAEAVLITISGSGFDTWTLICPYFRRDDQFIFQPMQEKRDPGAEVELLGDWTGRTGAA